MPNDNHVTITNVRIPMGSLVVLFIKMGIAAVPAVLILSIVGAFVAASVGAWVALAMH